MGGASGHEVGVSDPEFSVELQRCHVVTLNHMTLPNISIMSTMITTTRFQLADRKLIEVQSTTERFIAISIGAISTSHGLSIESLNVRSIGKKAAAVCNIFASLHLDVLVLQETWHENADLLKEGKVLLVATHRQQLDFTNKVLVGPGHPNAESDGAATPSADDALQAEDFSKFFTDKIGQIRKETDGVPETEYASNPGASFSMFQPTTAKQLEDMIAGASNKHRLLDPAPSPLIKTMHPCCRHIYRYCLIDQSRRPNYLYLSKQRSLNH